MKEKHTPPHDWKDEGPPPTEEELEEIYHKAKEQYDETLEKLINDKKTGSSKEDQ